MFGILEVYGWVVCILLSSRKQIVHGIGSQPRVERFLLVTLTIITDLPLGGVLTLGSVWPLSLTYLESPNSRFPRMNLPLTRTSLLDSAPSGFSGLAFWDINGQHDRISNQRAQFEP